MLRLSLLASVAIIALAKAGPVAAQSTTQSGPDSSSRSGFEVSLENILSAAESSLVAGAIKLTQDPRELFESGCVNSGSNCSGNSETGWLLNVVPEIDIKTGDAGTFQRLNGKLSGHYIYAPLASAAASPVPGVPVLDLERLHVFPFGAQIETTRSFNSVATIAEIGYVPFRSIRSSAFDQPFLLGTNPYFGMFLQGGYKFAGANNAVASNASDQSSEAANDWVARAKFHFAFDLALPSIETPFLAANSKLMTRATAWYDIANDDFYHSQSVTLRFQFLDHSKRNFDLKFENGSGEPNFNTGSQFTAGLSWTY